MLIICLFGFLMIFKALEIRIHLYSSDNDDYLHLYRERFIIYDVKAFLNFLSLFYGVLGIVLIMLSLFHAYINQLVPMIVTYGLLFYLSQLVLGIVGKKYYKKRFS